MRSLTLETHINLAGLVRDIIQNNPPLTNLNFSQFSGDKDGNESAGSTIMEAILNSSVNSIQDLNLSNNQSWFKNGKIIR